MVDGRVANVEPPDARAATEVDVFVSGAGGGHGRGCRLGCRVRTARTTCAVHESRVGATAGCRRAIVERSAHHGWDGEQVRGVGEPPARGPTRVHGRRLARAGRPFPEGYER